MADNFEHIVAEKVSGFQINPTKQVWDGVEAELDKTKRRRSPLFWWIPLGLLLLLSGIYLMHRNTKEPILSQRKSVQTGPKKAIPIVPIVPFNAAQSINNNSTNSITETQQYKHLDQQKLIPKKIDQASKIVANEKLIILGTTDTPAIEQNKMKTTGEEKTSGFPNSSVPIISKTVSDTTTISISSTPTNLTSATSAQQVSTKRKNYWALNLAAGRTNINETPFFISNAAANSLAYLNTSGSFGTPNTISLISANNGFHLQVGLSRHLQLNKRWGLELGLQYRYLQIKQQVGSKKDSTLNISDQVTDNHKSVVVPSYYQAGNNSVLTNSAHWIMLPVLIQFNLNPSAKINWQLYTGANASLNFAGKWLLTDDAYQVLYYSKPLSNQFLFNIQAGIRVQFSKQFTLGFGWEKSLTSVSKLSYYKNYWNQYSLQFSKPVQLSKSKHHKN